MVRELRREGFSFERTRMVVRFLQVRVPEALAETASVSTKYHLPTAGRVLYRETSPHEIVDLVSSIHSQIPGSQC